MPLGLGLMGALYGAAWLFGWNGEGVVWALYVIIGGMSMVHAHLANKVRFPERSRTRPVRPPRLRLRRRR
jgi:hypothetical protein